MYKLDNRGVSRKAIEVNCKQCQKSFVTFAAPSRKGKFCSTDCVYTAKAKPVILQCAQCKKEFKRRPGHINNSKSGLRFCSKECKCKAQRIGGMREIMPNHYGTTKTDYRSFFTKNELICNRCGYKEFDCAVQIHHKDRNRENNQKENLVPLCANCHYALHTNQWILK
ncbi:HNH endonuclease signature motif containing protein [Acinetobacter sp.]|uniref:HNH endonuclease signature motif containing protein n=1 Tax=Acinetobacter sp. TaxID=472 RepID=UPI0037524813